MSSGGAERDISAALAAMWERRRESFGERAAAMAAAIDALAAGGLAEPERAEAEREAHKLAGSLGTFGLPAGSEIARELEIALATPPAPGNAPRLAELALALQREIARGPAPAAPSEREAEPQLREAGDRIVVVSGDDDLAEPLTAEIAMRGLAGLRARADEEIDAAAGAAAAVIVDLAPAGDCSRGLDQLGRLHRRQPSVPVVVLAPRGDLELRVEVARRGGAVFLERSASTAEVMEAVGGLLERRRTAESRVVALDDDPAVLEALSALLASEGVELTGVTNPRRLWEILPDLAPELLILDVDMPEVDGIDLCRALRGDPRFADLPVLFLTARTEPALLDRI